MVYFKQKIIVCAKWMNNRDPYKRGNWGVAEGYMLYVDVHITTINQLSIRGLSWTTPIVIAFTWCVTLKKVPGTIFRIERSSHDTPYCSVPVSTQKNSASHFLSFSTRLHDFFPVKFDSNKVSMLRAFDKYHHLHCQIIRIVWSICGQFFGIYRMFVPPNNWSAQSHETCFNNQFPFWLYI